jgi:ABC-type xylose transport system permease subunit
MVEPALFGPIDNLLGPVIEWVALALVVANFVTRGVAHRSHVRQAQKDADSVSRHPAHQAVTILLVIVSFYFATVDYNGGIVLSTLVLGMVITDFFEFESRKVEARTDKEIERPKASIVASLLVATYAGYQTVYFLLLEDLWRAVV